MFLRIVSDTGGLLTAEQPAVGVGLGVMRSFAGIALVLVAVWLGKDRRWGWIALPVLGLLVLVGTTPSDATNQITVDRAHGLVAWRTFTAQKELSADQVPVSDLTTASVQSGQAGGRLLLLRKDGSEIYPLDKNYAPAPVQYQVAHEIQLLIDRDRSAHAQ